MRNPHEPSAGMPGRHASVLDPLRYGSAALVLSFAIVTYDVARPKWGVLTILIGVGVFVSQLVPVTAVRAYGLWLGVFYVVQALASPTLLQSDLKTLEPNFVREFEVVEGLPGIEGVHRVTTDRLGYRTTRPIDYDSAAALRIFAIGASTTLQESLDDRQTSYHLLQEGLEAALGTAVEVVNTGVSGIRAVHHLATLRAIGRYHPDLVLIMPGVNDWNWQIEQAFPIDLDGVAASSPPWLEGFMLRNSLIGVALRKLFATLRQAPAGPERDQAGREIERGEYYTAQRDSLARAVRIEFLPDTVADAYAEALGAIMRECRELEVVCVFATQPSGYHEGADPAFQASFWMTPPNQDYTLTFGSMVHIAKLYNDYLLAEGARQGFLVCDVAAEIEPSFASFYDDVHFNQAGARRLAQALLPCMLRAVRAAKLARRSSRGRRPRSLPAGDRQAWLRPPGRSTAQRRRWSQARSLANGSDMALSDCDSTVCPPSSIAIV